ncbi:MAG: winged helix-turn-helix transcriptional regulator [Proteobacteria bacterium]|nr:winged helix-turn-helix transcriptional regulator [Pseudomonadota bacterium]
MKRKPVRSAGEADEVFAVVAAYFAVLAEPMRLKIMRAVCEDERSVGEIVEAVGATQTNVSRHLALMLRGGAVARRKVGNHVYYRVADPTMMELCRDVCMRIVARMDEDEPMRAELLHLTPRRTRARRAA